jgi:outer membrane protein TolC
MMTPSKAREEAWIAVGRWSRKGRAGPRAGAFSLLALLSLSFLAACAPVPQRDLGEVRRWYVAEKARDEIARGTEKVGTDGTRQAPPGEEIFAEDVERLDLDAVILYALDHNPRIQAARYRLLAAEAAERAAGWLPDPAFAWTHNFEELQTRNGPVEDVFSLTQRFPYWGKLSLERDAASARSRVQREDVLVAQLEVIRDVQRAYFAIHLTAEEIDINERTTRILERFVRIAQRKVAAGKGGQPDILLAEIELARLENERIDLLQRLETDKALLNTILDRSPGAHLPAVDLPDRGYQEDVDELIAWMLEHLPDLERHRHVIEENRSRLRLARLRYVPDLTVGVTYSSVGRSPVPGGAVESGEDAVGATAGVNVPLWFPKYSAEAGAARRMVDASVASLAGAELMSVYRVLELHVRVETALRQVKLLDVRILPNARQALRVLESGYEAGTVDFLKLLDAERALERFELELERARTELEKRRADLERAVGRPLGESAGDGDATR